MSRNPRMPFVVALPAGRDSVGESQFPHQRNEARL
jgi:hypothetical protein